MRPHELFLSLLAESFRNAGFEVEVADSSVRVAGVWFHCGELWRKKSLVFLHRTYKFSRHTMAPPIDVAVTDVMRVVGSELRRRSEREARERLIAERRAKEDAAREEAREARTALRRYCEDSPGRVGCDVLPVMGRPGLKLGYDDVAKKYVMVLADDDSARLLVLLDQLLDWGY